MADDPTPDDFAPDGTGPDGKAEWGDDLKDSSKRTLSSYMSALTKNPQTHNEYSIDDTDYSEASYTSADGSPAPLQMGGQDTGAETFTGELGTNMEAAAARTLFDTLSNSGKFDEALPSSQPLSSFLNKNSQIDGHSLLSDIKPTSEPFEPGIGDTTGRTAIPNPIGAPVQQRKISNILKGINRFNPSGATPYIDEGAFSAPGATQQMGFGVYDPEAEGVDFATLRRVAQSLLLRQTGHAKADDADPGDWNQADVIPSTVVQSGKKKISIEFLKSINAFGAPNKPSLPTELRYSDRDGSPLEARKSFGALNSNKEPFTGKNRLAMLAVAADGIGAILLGAVVVGGVIDILDTGGGSVPNDPASMRFGKNENAPLHVRVIRIMGVPRTNHTFIKCMIFGVIEFLGMGSAIPDPPASATSGWAAFTAWWTLNVVPVLGTAIKNVIWSSGYYANLFRVIRRDLQRFLDEAADIPTGGADPALAVFNLLLALNGFSSWRFFMVLAVIGDVALQRRNRSFPLGGRGSNPLERMPNNGQTRQAQSKIAKDKNALAWRHKAAPGRFILPTQLMTAFQVFDLGKFTPEQLLQNVGDGKNDPGAMWPTSTPYWKKQQRNYRGSESGRLPQEMVTALENQLEIEYMPFYLHDLRTNEIIGLHGFLENIKDSYSVSYSDSSGYGRIDKVKIYQSTERSVNIDFWLVSTSRSDFDSMWFTVNKLITLLYPQWSMGKRVQAGDKHFVMPFSQIPTASPMVRLRVGDVIKSNYSRFNLARLFGISEAVEASTTGTSANDVARNVKPAFDISYDSQTGIDLEAYEDQLDAWNERYGSEPSSPDDYDHGFTDGEECTLLPNSGGYTTYDRGSTLHSPAPEGATHVETSAFLSRVLTGGRVKVLGRFWLGMGDLEDGVEPETVESHSMRNAGHNVEYVVTWTDPDNTADPYSKALADKGHYHHYVVLQEDLLADTPEPAELDNVVTEDEQLENIAQFFSPDNNAIVSSFEAAGGRGLAGFITSFDMDWNSALWDMGGMGRRAPTAMKISIAFSPIHDIPPGIDNNGFMRSVNYPVGKIAGALGSDQYDEGGPDTYAVAPASGTGSTRRAGGVDGSRLTRERFEAAVNEAFAVAGDEDS